MRARLLEFSIDNLYGLYNHKIILNGSESISILHGPNGVGKTALLKSISYLFSCDFEALSKIPFNKINAVLDSGIEVSVTRLVSGSLSLDDRIGLESAKLEVVITNNSKLTAKHTFSPGDANKSRQYALWYRSAIAHGAKDLSFLSDEDAHRVYDSNIEEAFETISMGKKSSVKSVKSVKSVTSILKSFSVHFVETNRLFRHNVSSDPAALGGATGRTVLTVQECAKDLVVRISSALKNYGAESQQLDQSFPHRFISETTPSMEVDELKEKLTQIGLKLKDLRTIGLLDAEYVQPFEIESLDSVERNKIEIMSLYVRDSQAKLEVFDSILARVQLLLGSINLKFRNKRVLLSKTRGFFVKLDSGAELSLEFLSSGEQHELVLMYELLFKVPSDTLVLIDEPELSLHVSWQKAFLPELISISKEVGFTAVVATHSPFIVGDRHDLMSALDAELDHE
ncbi:hypothetical protein NX10_13925 [Pseudomonas fluorescens]|uniref:AAA family ATPase n=1 Tax=Pseudomonas fluorescens TaxID=294 RepID=UPI000584927A|nr:AAA family ATPase [Pseudomonas fluorescens]KIF60759.1 hypothetical protein NX10_13925 [Pseudomonas fluorescens]